MILTDEEVNVLRLTSADAFELVAKAEAAILAKLASAELPEKVVIDRHESGIVIRGYTADQLRQAYAQGAAAQLSVEPSGFIDRYGEIFAEAEQMLSTDTPLYTRRQANHG